MIGPHVWRMALNAGVTESAPIHTSMLTVKTKTNNKLFLNANETRCPGDLFLQSEKALFKIVIHGFNPHFLSLSCSLDETLS